MHVSEHEIIVPHCSSGDSILEQLRAACEKQFAAPPIRLVVTRTDSAGLRCEIALLHADEQSAPRGVSALNFVKRPYENSDRFTAALVIPTGIGAEIGGHAGDANAVSRLLAASCDTLITHPNVVNASDINALPDNGLYVEGSVIARLLMGTCALRPVRSNRILLVMDKHEEEIVMQPTINAVSAARATLGAEVKILALERPAIMSGHYAPSGRAVGRIENLERLFDAIAERRATCDAVALASVIRMPEEAHKAYLDGRGEVVNPWGGVEAMLTHAVSHCFAIPSAHAPMVGSSEGLRKISDVVDPRMAAEEISSAFLHCVLVGLHRAPRVLEEKALFLNDGNISAANVSCLVIPDRCVGLPTLAALEQGIQVIAVRENRNNMCNDLEKLPFEAGKLTIVENYLEAAGVLAAMRAGVSLESIRRPLADTQVRILRDKY